MEAAGVPMLNDVEEIAESARLLAPCPGLRNSVACDRLPPASFTDRAPANSRKKI
jgi:hypothetical protein